jgi:hypothetical protein
LQVTHDQQPCLKLIDVNSLRQGTLSEQTQARMVKLPHGARIDDHDPSIYTFVTEAVHETSEW